MNWIFRIENNVDTFDVTPYEEKGLTWSPFDPPRIDYEVESKDFTFFEDDYDYFLALEQADNRCDEQTLKVFVQCADGQPENLIFTGKFTMSSGAWDLDTCKVTFKINWDDPYRCIDENDEEINIFDYGHNTETASLPYTYGYEAYRCYDQNGSPSCSQPFLDANFWGLYNQYRWRPLAGIEIRASLYLRHYIIIDPSYSLSGDWNFLETLPEGDKYVKQYVAEHDPFYGGSNLEEIAYLHIDGADSEVRLNYEDPIEEIDNGMHLLNVLQSLLNSSCSSESYTIVSDFFQWNPENESLENYVTGATNNLTNLIIFQKSDVKRPIVSGNATKAETSFLELLEWVCDMFNCRYRIIDNDFRIEHISFWYSDLGVNLVNNEARIKLLQGTKKYSYDREGLPKFERFEFMEAGSLDFIGEDIEYDSDCVQNDPENRVTINLDKITTDVVYCLENPEGGNEFVSDDGFVIVACDADNNILFEDPILDDNLYINNVLSWAHLHRDFFLHGRVLSNGLMNGTPTNFLSVKPSIKQDKFNVTLKCTEIISFDPVDKIKALLGWGNVLSAELDLSTCVFGLELALEEIEDVETTIELGDFDENFDSNFD